MSFTFQRLAFICSLLATTLGSAWAKSHYEVWAIDQSNSPGKTYGGTLYIYDGAELERGHAAATQCPRRSTSVEPRRRCAWPRPAPTRCGRT